MSEQDAFTAIADSNRRHILEELRRGPKTVGELADGLPVSRPAVSQHLKVLLESGFAVRRAEGNRRLYRLDPTPIAEVDAWLAPFRRFWENRLDALATEIRRGRRQSGEG